jgi:hypothetical protein
MAAGWLITGGILIGEALREVRTISMIDPAFLNIFGAWFNVDLIDLGDSQAVEDAARACAVDFRTNLSASEQLITQLTNVLETWDTKTVMEFIHATDVDWFFNVETEQKLKEIIAIIIDELRFHDKNQTD